MTPRLNTRFPRGVDRQPNGRYRARVYWDGAQHQIGAFDTLTDTKAALRLARSQIAAGTFTPPSVRRTQRKAAQAAQEANASTVAQFADRWLEHLQDEGRTPATLRSYRSTLSAHIVPAIGSKRLDEIAQTDIDDLLASLRTKPGARVNVARTIRTLLLAAVATRHLPAMPVVIRIAKSRDTLARGQVATPKQVAALEQLMPARLALTVPLAAWLALRQGEVLGLQRADFDLTAGALTITRQWASKAQPRRYAPTKSGHSRTLAIPPQLIPRIRAHLTEHTPDGPAAPVFPGREHGAPVSQTTLDAAWRATRDEIIPGLRFHDLRHTGLTEFARTGATAAEIQARGGHSDARTAMIYQHANLEREQALAALLPIGE